MRAAGDVTSASLCEAGRLESASARRGASSAGCSSPSLPPAGLPPVFGRALWGNPVSGGAVCPPGAAAVFGPAEARPAAGETVAATVWGEDDCSAGTAGLAAGGGATSDGWASGNATADAAAVAPAGGAAGGASVSESSGATAAVGPACPSAPSVWVPTARFTWTAVSATGAVAGSGICVSICSARVSSGTWSRSFASAELSGVTSPGASTLVGWGSASAPVFSADSSSGRLSGCVCPAGRDLAGSLRLVSWAGALVSLVGGLASLVRGLASRAAGLGSDRCLLNCARSTADSDQPPSRGAGPSSLGSNAIWSNDVNDITVVCLRRLRLQCCQLLLGLLDQGDFRFTFENLAEDVGQFVRFVRVLEFR